MTATRLILMIWLLTLALACVELSAHAFRPTPFYKRLVSVPGMNLPPVEPGLQLGVSTYPVR